MQDNSQNDPNFPSNVGQNQPQQVPQQVPDPVTNPAKEAQPFYDNSGSKDNYIEVSEKEPEIKPEVESAGVYKVSDKIKLSNAERAAGFIEAKESTPVSTDPSDNIKLPISAAQAQVSEKGSPNSSRTWLAKIVLLYLKKIGRTNA